MPSVFSAPLRLHASNPNLSTIDFVEEKNYSDGLETSAEFSKMQEDLCHVAHKGNWDFHGCFCEVSGKIIKCNFWACFRFKRGKILSLG